VALRSLTLWFDFVSPYAYFAWKSAPAFCETHELELVPKPVLFAALLNHWGQLGPAEIAPKRIFTFKHCVRRAARRGLPFGLPPAHPFNPLLPLRIAALEMPRDARARVIDALFDAAWGGGPGIDSPERVRGVLDEAGLDGASLIERAGEVEHKGAFRAMNEEAIAAGVFGVPTLAVDEELFWGSDIEEDLAMRLAGDDPIDREDWSKLVDLPEGATRRATPA
jgi:2-hydroxychromene-2-carboxylate isomerase